MENFFHCETNLKKNKKLKKSLVTATGIETINLKKYPLL